MRAFLLFINIFILTACSELNRTRDKLTENAQVYADDAFNSLERAKNFNQKNNDIHRQSIAQIVFPKAVKCSFIFGEN